LLLHRMIDYCPFRKEKQTLRVCDEAYAR